MILTAEKWARIATLKRRARYLYLQITAFGDDRNPDELAAMKEEFNEVVAAIKNIDRSATDLEPMS